MGKPTGECALSDHLLGVRYTPASACYTYSPISHLMQSPRQAHKVKCNWLHFQMQRVVERHLGPVTVPNYTVHEQPRLDWVQNYLQPLGPL